jgi:hypothetical protein
MSEFSACKTVIVSFLGFGWTFLSNVTVLVASVSLWSSIFAPYEFLPSYLHGLSASSISNSGGGKEVVTNLGRFLSLPDGLDG